MIEYVREKYGRDCVANIVTFGTFGAKDGGTGCGPGARCALCGSG